MPPTSKKTMVTQDDRQRPPPTLTDVLRLYDRQHPQRARGGLFAISGFIFQIHAYLAAFALTLVRGTPAQLERAGGLFEAFSDYVRTQGDTIVFAQAKLTLSPKALIKAAEEFVEIDGFLAANAPELRAIVSYEVVASRRPQPLRDASGGRLTSASCWDDIALPAEASGSGPSRQERLEVLRRAGQLRPPRIMRDPWWRLISVVYDVLDDPFSFAYEATALCLGRGSTPDGAGRLRDEIANLFSRHRDQRQRQMRPDLGQVMLPRHVAPVEHPSTTVIVGQIPSVEHLQDGCFMDREPRLTAALVALDGVLETRQATRERAVHTFWIDGRSGCGKSVLLLQVMRELVLKRQARVIWLRNASRDLLPLLRMWACAPSGTPARPDQDSDVEARGGAGTEPVFIFVDDFYAPDERAQIDLPGIRHLLADGPRTDWPILVTCGPRDQHVTMSANYEDCELKLTTWQLPAADAGEGRGLRAWYKRRTGRDPKTGTAAGEDEGLLVSMAYEMHRGDLRAFAIRFRRRMASAGLVDVVAPILALNRLYLRAPASWLPDKELNRLRHLNRDGDFDLPDSGNTGPVRLTHPHLSDAIYQALRAEEVDAVRVGDLTGAFRRALEDAPDIAIQVLGLVVGRHERLNILPAKNLAEGLAQVWAAFPEPLRSFDDQARAWVWVLWAQLGSQHPGVRRHVPDGPAQVFAALQDQPGHVNWPLMWFRLLEVCDGGAGEPPGGTSLSQASGPLTADPTRSDVLLLGFEWLKEHAARDADDWAMVWEELVGRGSDLPVGLSVPLLLRLGFDWLKGHEDSGLWGVVWRDLMDHRDLTTAKVSQVQLLGLGFEWLKGHEDPDSWDNVWRGLLGHRDLGAANVSQVELLRLGFDWLKGHEDSFSWNDVWRDLVGRNDLVSSGLSTELLRYGLDWLKGHEDSFSWDDVWRGLLDHRDLAAAGLSIELLRYGLDWLKGHEDSYSWGGVWRGFLGHRDLTAANVSQVKLLGLGFEWLKGHENSYSWSDVWRGLVGRHDLATAKVSQVELLGLGFEWLKGHEDSYSWGGVWRDLVGRVDLGTAKVSQIELLRLGLDWLKGHEDSGSWGYVWRDLLGRGDLADAALSTTELLRLGFEWVKGRETSFSAGAVLAGLLDHPADLPPGASVGDILRLALAWLALDRVKAHFAHLPAWPTLLLATLPHLSCRPVDLAMLISLGRAWVADSHTRVFPDRPAVEAALATAEATLASSQAAATDDPS